MNITLNINIESININLNAQAPVQRQEPAEFIVEMLPATEDLTPVQHKPVQQTPEQRLTRMLRISEKIRTMLGNDAANTFLAGRA